MLWATRKNLCRTRPFPWSLHSIRRSPFKTLKNAKRALHKKPGQRGFTATASLRSMGKIPRVAKRGETKRSEAKRGETKRSEAKRGTNSRECYVIGDKYKNKNTKERGTVG